MLTDSFQVKGQKYAGHALRRQTHVSNISGFMLEAVARGLKMLENIRWSMEHGLLLVLVVRLRVRILEVAFFSR